MLILMSAIDVGILSGWSIKKDYLKIVIYNGYFTLTSGKGNFVQLKCDEYEDFFKHKKLYYEINRRLGVYLL